MNQRIYPSWEQIKQLKNPLTEGEIHLLKFFDDNLPTDPNWTESQKLSEYQGWLIFAQPFLNGSRPDVIIFNPYVGIVIYEVKDWKLAHYEWKKDYEGYTSLFVSDSKGSYPIKNPINQVNHYKEKIIGQLVPNIGEIIDKNKKNYGLIKTALYFHKIDTSTAQDFFGTKIKNFKYFPVFGRDLLTNSNLSQIVPDVQYSKSRYWDRDWNKELMFWFYPPYHSIEQGIPLTLKGNQNKVAEPAPGHHRVRGVAGSGKTQALAYRAGKLASNNMNVLIISFNITLWHYVRDMISRAPFAFKWDKFTFTHFHGFCKDKLNEFGKKWPVSPNRKDFSNNEEYEKALDHFFKVTVAQTVREAVLNKQYDKYDAILIDEGQDYHFEWYSLLNDLFLKERDELLVVSDKKQNIYERQLDWVDKRVTRDGLDKFNKPYIDLTSSFRMPAKVAEMSNEFSDLFELNQDLRVAKIEGTPVLFHSQHIIWLNVSDDLWLDYVYNSFLRLQKEEYTPSDMVILLPSHSYGIEAVKFFKGKNIETNHVFEDDTEAKYHPHKKAFWMGDSRLKISTIHSFKGWELLNIILFIPKKAPESNKKLDAIVYTAITRTRENLIVLNANKRYSEFGEKFPKKWAEQ